MRNNTLNFDYMKAKVKSESGEWMFYAFTVMYVAAIVIVAVSSHS
jgi:hypothetical protein